MSNEFWAFSLATYAAEGVAERALAVQDALGLDVNVILYGAFLASQGRLLTPFHLRGLEATITPWRQRVVQPLRFLRVALRDYPEAGAVREEIKALELRSEQDQQDMMWRYFTSSDALPTEDDSLRENLGLLIDADRQADSTWVTLVDRLAMELGV